MHVPVSLDMAGRPVLVVGDGPGADRRARSFTDAGAEVTRLAGDAYTAAALDGQWLVVVDAAPAVNAAVSADADSAGLWCNAADDPEHCSFLVPAVVRRGSVTVAVSTGGASPALASWLRRELEDAVGPEFAELALRLAEERRRIHGAGGSTEGVDWTSRIEAHLRALRASV